MKKPYRYHTAAESKVPGYLKRRFEAYRRLQRMQARSSGNVAPLVRKKGTK